MYRRVLEAIPRAFMGPNSGPAQWPDCNRYVEATMVMLLEIFPSSKRDGKSKQITRWSLIHRAYNNIRQCILGNARVMEETELQLPFINQTTLTQWYNKRDKKQERDILSQGLNLPQASATSAEPIPPPIQKRQVLPTATAGTPFRFNLPLNRSGIVKLKERKVAPKASPSTSAVYQHPLLPEAGLQQPPLIYPPMPLIYNSPLQCPFAVQPQLPSATSAVSCIPYKTQYNRKRAAAREMAGIPSR